MDNKIVMGDLVREHTRGSKKRLGLVHEIHHNCWLHIKWLDGTVDRYSMLRSIYEVTRESELT